MTTQQPAERLPPNPQPIHRPQPRRSLTKEEQLMALSMFVPDYALGERRAGVAGGKDWTPHEWVIHCLDVIFGSDCWSNRIGVLQQTRTDDGEILIHIPVELEVIFADGTRVVRSDIGTGVVRQTKEARANDIENLEGTPIDNFSTGWKSAVTSGLKGCCRDLGRIFIPMQATWVQSAISSRVLERDIKTLVLPAPELTPEESQEQLEANKKLLGRDEGDLVGSQSSGNGKIDWVTKFWAEAGKLRLGREEANEFLNQAGGDFETAHQLMMKMVRA